MNIYILLDEFCYDTIVLGAFSTKEKAADYAETFRGHGSYQYIIEKVVDDPYAPDNNPIETK